jgi:hypothetical protein
MPQVELLKKRRYRKTLEFRTSDNACKYLTSFLSGEAMPIPREGITKSFSLKAAKLQVRKICGANTVLNPALPPLFRINRLD